MNVKMQLNEVDAEIVADILRHTGNMIVKSREGQETASILKLLENQYGSPSMSTRVKEIEGAFRTALRGMK